MPRLFLKILKLTFLLVHINWFKTVIVSIEGSSKLRVLCNLRAHWYIMICLGVHLELFLWIFMNFILFTFKPNWFKINTIYFTKYIVSFKTNSVCVVISITLKNVFPQIIWHIPKEKYRSSQDRQSINLTHTWVWREREREP